jgi:hypothetical protein
VVAVASSTSVVWTEQLLRRVQDILSREYTQFSLQNSSLMQMSRAVTVLRFVQLLLLFLADDHSTHRPSPLPASTTALSIDDTHRMIAALVQQWTRGVADFVLEAWKHCQATTKSMEDDESEQGHQTTITTARYHAMTADAAVDNDPRPVFCFCFASLLRMDDYVRQRHQLLMPVYKGLCELAQVLVAVPQHCITNEWQDSMPSTLLPGAIQALCNHLHSVKKPLENIVIQASTVDASQDAPSSIAYPGKVLNFVASRLSHLMRVYFVLDQSASSKPKSPETGNDELMTECWKTLFSLRGMATTMQLFESARIKSKSAQVSGPQNLAQLKVLCEIAAKTGQYVQSVLLLDTKTSPAAKQSQGAPNLLESAVESIVGGNREFIAPEGNDKVDRGHIAQFRTMSQALGRVSVLQSALDKADIGVLEHIELLLAIVEDLLFVSIPQCLAACTLSAKNNYDGSRCSTLPSTFLFKSLETMARVLTEVSEDSSKLPQLHRLLVRWLAGPSQQGNDTSRQHPMSRDLVLLLIQSYIGATPHDVGDIFISYLTKILFDGRTAPLLRSNVSALLIRLQTSSDLHIQESSKFSIESELGASIQDRAGKGSKKRKRKGRRARSLVRDPQEVSDIARAVRGDGMSTSLSKNSVLPVFRKAIIRLYHVCCKEEENGRENPLIPFAERNAFLMALLERFLLSETKDCNVRFHEHIGLDMFDFVKRILGSVLRIKFDPIDDAGSLQEKIFLYGAAMRLSATLSEVFRASKSGNTPVDSICSIITKSVSKRFLLKSDDILVASFRSAIGFLSLKVLGSVGAAIPPDWQDSMLQGIKKCFVRLLSSDDWPIATFGITALSRFGTTIDVTHKHILRPCLPDSCLKLFQCRVSKKVWTNNNLGEVERDGILIASYADHLLHEFCFVRKRVGSCVFPPEATLLSIVNGSYILEMTTQGRRTAKVVFPPGLESLEDIEYMLGGTGQRPSIHTVKRFFTTATGDVTCLLHSSS